MEDKDLDLIEKYYRGELAEAALLAFQQKLEADDAFRQKAELHARAMEAIRLKGRETLKNRFRERDRMLDGTGDKKFVSNRVYLLIIALLFFVAFVLLMWGLNRESSEKTEQPQLKQEEPIIDSLENIPKEDEKVPVAKGDSLLPKVPVESKKPETPETERRSRKELLFAAYFEPYKDESLNPSVRGEENLEPYERFQLYYWEDKHAEVLVAFDELSPSLKTKDNLLFQKANSLLQTGKTEEAITLLENILRNNRSRFVAEAKWYLALSLLKKGEMEKAKRQFGEIAGDERSPRREAAKQVLEEIR